MTEKTIHQRLIELQGLSNLCQQQLRLATIAAYHHHHPQAIANFLNEALALLNASTPKILIIKDLLTHEENNHNSDGLRPDEGKSFDSEMAGGQSH